MTLYQVFVDLTILSSCSTVVFGTEVCNLHQSPVRANFAESLALEHES
jgi:hypothetical protein